jgi:hypothetical protein
LYFHRKLVKTNQSYDVNGVAVFMAPDFKLVAPDGRIYDFTGNSVVAGNAGPGAPAAAERTAAA